MAVQVFTVSTIAHVLIAEDDFLARLLHTLLAECESKKNRGK